MLDVVIQKEDGIIKGQGQIARTINRPLQGITDLPSTEENELTLIRNDQLTYDQKE